MSTTEIGSKIDSRLNLGDKEKICKIVLEIIRQNKRSFALLSLKVNKFSRIFWHWKKKWLKLQYFDLAAKHMRQNTQLKKVRLNIDKKIFQSFSNSTFKRGISNKVKTVYALYKIKVVNNRVTQFTYVQENCLY